MFKVQMIRAGMDWSHIFFVPDLQVICVMASLNGAGQSSHEVYYGQRVGVQSTNQ
jgi:hypothetical protein